MMKVWLNGEILPVDEARLSVTDHGFLYGYGLFETLRAYQGHPFLLDEHLARLARGLQKLAIDIDIAEIRQAVGETLTANEIREGRVRITVSAGEGGMVPDQSTCRRPTRLVLAGEYRPPSEEVYLKGYSAVISSVVRQSRDPLAALKSSAYLPYIYARNEARRAGADEAIMLTEKGLLSEASMSNIFMVSGGVLVTPGESGGILPGITRRRVIELAEKMGVRTQQGEVNPARLYAAAEVFLTNSLLEIMPLTAVDGKPVGGGRLGALTARLRIAYREMVEDFLRSAE